jgi:hypothetical protein
MALTAELLLLAMSASVVGLQSESRDILDRSVSKRVQRTRAVQALAVGSVL